MYSAIAGPNGINVLRKEVFFVGFSVEKFMQR